MDDSIKELDNWAKEMELEDRFSGAIDPVEEAALLRTPTPQLDKFISDTLKDKKQQIQESAAEGAKAAAPSAGHKKTEKLAANSAGKVTGTAANGAGTGKFNHPYKNRGQRGQNSRQKYNMKKKLRQSIEQQDMSFAKAFAEMKARQK